MTNDETTLCTKPSAEEAASLAAHNARKSSRDRVYDAILELSDSETPAKAADIANVTGLAMPIVYDSIKALKQRGRIYSDNGYFFACDEVQETQAVSHTILPSGAVKLEKGDQVMDLNPREARALAKTLAGSVEQAAVILLQHRHNDLQAQMRRMHRRVEKLTQELARAVPNPQMAMDLEA